MAEELTKRDWKPVQVRKFWIICYALCLNAMVASGHFSNTENFFRSPNIPVDDYLAFFLLTEDFKYVKQCNHQSVLSSREIRWDETLDADE